MILGFKKQFILPIQIGTKVFTMRKRRKIRPKIGETLRMWSGLRTKYTQHISSKEKLMSIQNVRILIKREQRARKGEWYYDIQIYVDGKFITDTKQFSIYDGFENVFSWADFWLTDKRGKKKNRVGALVELFHWTDLKY